MASRLPRCALIALSVVMSACREGPLESSRRSSSGELLLIANAGESSVWGVDLKDQRRSAVWQTRGHSPIKLRTSPSGEHVAAVLIGAGIGAPWITWNAMHARAEVRQAPAQARFSSADFIFLDENRIAITASQPGILIVGFPELDSLGFIAAPLVEDDGERNHLVFDVVQSPRNRDIVWGVQTVVQALVAFDVAGQRVVRVVREPPHDARLRWRGMAFTRDGNEMWLWTSAGVSARDPDTGAHRRDLPSLGAPEEVIFSRSGEYAVMRYAFGRIRVASTQTLEVLHETQLNGNIADWDVAVDTDILYVAMPVVGEWVREGVFVRLEDGVVVTLDIATLREIGRVPAGRNPESVRAVRLPY